MWREMLAKSASLPQLPALSRPAVRYALLDPWDKPGAKRPSGPEMDAWGAAVKTSRADADLAQYRRISARTIVHIADALGAEPKSE